MKYGENLVDLWIFVFKLKVNAGKYSNQLVVWLSQKLLMYPPKDLWTRSMIPFTEGEYGDMIWCFDAIRLFNSCKTLLSNSLPPSLTDCR